MYTVVNKSSIGTIEKIHTFIDFGFEVGLDLDLVAAALAACFIRSGNIYQYENMCKPNKGKHTFFFSALALLAFLVLLAFFSTFVVLVFFDLPVFLLVAAAVLLRAFFDVAGFASIAFVPAGFAFLSEQHYQLNKMMNNASKDKFTSLLEEGLSLGASLTLPEGPFGRAKMPIWAPCAIARLSCDALAPSISSLYFSVIY